MLSTLICATLLGKGQEETRPIPALITYSIELLDEHGTLGDSKIRTMDGQSATIWQTDTKSNKRYSIVVVPHLDADGRISSKVTATLDSVSFPEFEQKSVQGRMYAILLAKPIHEEKNGVEKNQFTWQVTDSSDEKSMKTPKPKAGELLIKLKATNPHSERPR